jgi:hypothetical protein
MRLLYTTQQSVLDSSLSLLLFMLPLHRAPGRSCVMKMKGRQRGHDDAHCQKETAKRLLGGFIP